MSFYKKLMNLFQPELSSADLNETKLLEWLGIDRAKPKALAETTYFTCLKVLAETMGKLPLKLY